MISKLLPTERMLVKTHFLWVGTSRFVRVATGTLKILQVILPGLWFPVPGCFSDGMFVLFVFYTTPAKHSETSEKAVTASPQDIMEQMDSWTSLPSIPIPQASVGVGKKKCAFLILLEWSLGNFQFWAFKFQEQCYF